VFIGELSNGESYLKKDGKYVVEAMLFSDENRVFYPNWNTKEIITIKLEGDKHNVLNKDGTIDKSFNTPQEAKAYITSIL
jgi:hypothetical protein